MEDFAAQPLRPVECRALEVQGWQHAQPIERQQVARRAELAILGRSRTSAALDQSGVDVLQARAIRKSREAALADPEGKALGGALGKPVTWLKAVKS